MLVTRDKWIDGRLCVARGREIRRKLSLKKMPEGGMLEIRWTRERSRGLMKGEVGRSNGDVSMRPWTTE
jgi:hypothetical protein